MGGCNDAWRGGGVEEDHNITAVTGHPVLKSSEIIPTL